MIPLYGMVAEFLQARAAAPESPWHVLRQHLMNLKGVNGDRSGTALRLAELVYDAYAMAGDMEIRLDAALKEVHRARMDEAEGRSLVSPRMYQAIAALPRDKYSIDTVKVPPR